MLADENQTGEHSPLPNDAEITENNPMTAIKELQANFSVGPDGFPVVLKKKVRENLGEPLSIMWRDSLKTGVILTL